MSGKKNVSRDKVSTCIFYVFVVLILTMTALIWKEAPSQTVINDVGLEHIWYGDEWYYCDNHGNILNETPISNHKEVYLRLDVTDSKVAITKVLDRDTAENEYLLFRTRAPRTFVYINDEIYYTKEYKDEYKPYSFRMYMLHQIPVGDLKAGDVIRIELQTDNLDSVTLQYFSLGDRYSLLVYVMKCAKSSLFICAVAVIIIMVNIFTSHSKMLSDTTRQLKALRWINSFLIASAIYICTDSGCMDMYIGKMAVTDWLDCISLLMLPMPFIMYTKITFFPSHKRYDCLAMINFLLVIFSVIGYIFFAYNLSQSFWPVYFIILSGIIMSIVSFIQEKEMPYIEVLIGYLSILISSVISIFTYIEGLVYPGSTVFGYGLIIFSICMVIWTVRSSNEMRKIREEAELAFMKRDVEEAEEANAQKSRFLSHMSHEIRTPLNAVLGMNELILRETKDKKIRSYAENIQNSGRTLLALINDVLDFSKIETGKLDIVPTDYSLSSALYDVILMIREKANQKGVELRINIAEDIPDMLYGDEIRIKQIMLNLLSNAVKYTTEGWIELKVYKRDVPDEKQKMQILLFIEVSDTGIGIKKDDVGKLFCEFERFDHIKNRGVEGTGLGLSITSRLVSAMNGEITVDSEYQKGSIFKVNLPQRVVSREVIGDYKTRFERITSKNGQDELTHNRYPEKRIFAIDDNETNLDVIAAILEMLDITVDKSTSAKSAIQRLKQEKYDLILTDDMMPDMNGTELMQYIKTQKNQANFETPIIVLTANAVVGAREEYLKKGFDDYMTKPIDIDILQKLLDKYLL